MDYSSQSLISIIIPTSGTTSELQRCLTSCVRAMAAMPLEVIVVFDQKASSSVIAEVRNRFSKFTILVSETAGATSARNLGLKNISGNNFLLIDDDCVLGDQQWLDLIVERSQGPIKIHGGGYKLAEKSSYWAQVYNWVNYCWLQFGRNSKGLQDHLLGGFLFGSKETAKKVSFNPSMKWGGEEKELLLRLRRDFNIQAQLHDDLFIEHHDVSGFKKLVHRAFRQGIAAGFGGLQTPGIRMPLPIHPKLIPGLIVFYCFSRAGILLGKLDKIKNGNVNIAETSPAA